MKKLLLHICCAPCSAYISRARLQPRFDLTWYFYNPNISSLEEYEKRLAAVRLIADKYQIPLVIESYQPDAWQVKTRGHKKDPERGPRCLICYYDRLEKTVLYAQEHGFDLFSTSLFVSPYKDTAALRRIGSELEADYQVEFLNEDFQTEDGYRKSQALARELGIYRQKFCGCEYSLTQSV